LDIRSRQLHDQWLRTLRCSIIYFAGEYTIEEYLAVLMGERVKGMPFLANSYEKS
jgi:hypothetical protein